MNPTTSQAETSPIEKRQDAGNRQTPTVSVIVQGEIKHSLHDTLRNLNAQSLHPHEILVFDDGSDSDAARLIDSAPGEARLVSSNKPGAADAALEQATGQYIQLLGTLDLLSLNKLECQARTMEDEQASLVYGPWAPIRIAADQSQMPNTIFRSAPAPGGRNLLSQVLDNWAFAFQGCLFRRTFLQEIGLPISGILKGRGLEFLAGILLRNPRIAFENETLALRGTPPVTADDPDEPPPASDRASFLAALVEKGPPSLIESARFHERIRETLEELERDAPDAVRLRHLCHARARELGRQADAASNHNRRHSARGARKQSSEMTPHEVRLIEELGFTLS